MPGGTTVGTTVFTTSAAGEFSRDLCSIHRGVSSVWGSLSSCNRFATSNSIEATVVPSGLGGNGWHWPHGSAESRRGQLLDPHGRKTKNARDVWGSQARRSRPAVKRAKTVPPWPCGFPPEPSLISEPPLSEVFSRNPRAAVSPPPNQPEGPPVWTERRPRGGDHRPGQHGSCVADHGHHGDRRRRWHRALTSEAAW